MSSARSTPAERPPVAGRASLTSSAPAPFSAPRSASAGRSCVRARMLRPSSAAARPSAKARALPEASPSAIQTTSASLLAARKRCAAGSAAMRSGVKGCGFSARSRSSVFAASATSTSRPASEMGSNAVARPSRAAELSRSVTASKRWSQVGAAGQPSSRTTSTGPLPPSPGGKGFQRGPAMAKIISAARPRRSSNSHHGVRAGVSSFGFRSRMSFSGGKAIWRGRGGVMRSRYQSSGSSASAASTSGAEKASGSPAITRPPLASGQG